MKNKAFTLIEVLVACAMLAGLVLLLASVLDGLGNATRGVTRKIDASSQARIALNQLARDLGSMTTGAGATLVLGQSPGATGINDSLAFLTSGRGSNSQPDHRLLAVFYAVRNYSDSVLGVSSASLPILGRGFGSVPWGNSEGLDAAASRAATDINGATGMISDPDVIADGVIRMAVVLQLRDGRLIPFDPARPDFPTKTDFLRAGVTLPTEARAIDLSKVSAIIVGLAVLDEKTRSLAATDLTNIAAKLPRPAANQTPLQAWDFNSPTFANSFSGVPGPVRQGLRFYQRSFPLPSP